MKSLLEEKKCLINAQLNEIYKKTEGNPALKVAIIDGAIDVQHPDLQGANIDKITAEAVGCQKSHSPACQHGTFIAGILAAKRDSAAPGICPQCHFLSRPIFCEATAITDCPEVNQAELAAAVKESVAAGAKIINMSIGLSGRPIELSTELANAYNEAKRQGVLLVGASGNQGLQQVNSIFKHPWVIPVAAMDANGSIEPSSNQGIWIAEHGLMAPGKDITSVAAGGGHKKMTGTSVAAPFVSGTAALIWSLAPGLTAVELRDLLLQKLDKGSTSPPLKPLSGVKSMAQLQLTHQGKSNSMSSQLNEHATLELQATDDSPRESYDLPRHKSSPKNILTGTTAELIPQEIVTSPKYTEPDEVKPETIVPQDSDLDDSKQVYAVGILKPLFPNKGVEKAFSAAAQTLKVPGDDFYGVFTYVDASTQLKPYQYLAQEMQWVLEINAKATYLVYPRGDDELINFVNAQKPQGNSLEVVFSTVIGSITNNANYAESSIPEVLCSHLFSFTMSGLHDGLAKQKNIASEAIQDVIKNLEFEPNKGLLGGDRAKNFIAFGYPEIYEKTTDLKNRNNSTGKYFLKKISTKLVESDSDRVLVDVILNYQRDGISRTSHLYCCVDVTGPFPFINRPIIQYIPVHSE